MNYTASMFHRETVVLLTRATLDRKDPVLYKTLSRAIYITRISNQENNEKREYTIYSVTNSSLIQQISPLYCRHSQTAPVDTVTVIPSCLGCGKIHIIVSSAAKTKQLCFHPNGVV